MKHCSYDFLLNFCNSIAFTFNEAIQNPLAIKTKKKKKRKKSNAELEIYQLGKTKKLSVLGAP